MRKTFPCKDVSCQSCLFMCRIHRSLLVKEIHLGLVVHIKGTSHEKSVMATSCQPSFSVLHSLFSVTFTFQCYIHFSVLHSLFSVTFTTFSSISCCHASYCPFAQHYRWIPLTNGQWYRNVSMSWRYLVPHSFQRRIDYHMYFVNIMLPCVMLSVSMHRITNHLWWRTHRWPMDSSYKGPVIWLRFHVITSSCQYSISRIISTTAYCPFLGGIHPKGQWYEKHFHIMTSPCESSFSSAVSTTTSSTSCCPASCCPCWFWWHSAFHRKLERRSPVESPCCSPLPSSCSWSPRPYPRLRSKCLLLVITLRTYY